jgi:hypothetical protein
MSAFEMNTFASQSFKFEEKKIEPGIINMEDDLYYFGVLDLIAIEKKETQVEINSKGRLMVNYHERDGKKT